VDPQPSPESFSEPPRDVPRATPAPSPFAGWHDDPRVARRHRPRPSWLRPGLRTAAIVAAATGGVLVRYGVAGDIGALGAFNQVGRLVTGVTAVDRALAQHAATSVGVLVHVLVATTWALAYAIVAVDWRGLRRWLAAIAVAAFAWGIGQAVLPSVLRLGHGARATTPQVVLLHVVLALSLAVGMRLALVERDGR
jgi:hypothetical protein